MAGTRQLPEGWRAALAALRSTGAEERRSRADEAALLIRTLIFDGQLAPHARVPQDDVAAALDMSRIPVREALIALEREGWVTIELHRGAFVNALDARGVRDHYELYGLIYGFAARRALERSGPGELVGGLEALVAELRSVDDPAAFTRVAVAFHRTVVDAARSPRLKPLIRSLAQMVPGDFFSVVPDAMDVERKGLVAITRALGEADGDRAAAAYVAMMRDVGEAVQALLAERGLLDTDA